MAFLYSSSKTWRHIVNATGQSKGYMLAFAAACVGVPYILGDQVMKNTNEKSARGESELKQKLRSRGGIHAQMLAKAQKERLQVMLDEIKGRSADGEARYRAALDGQSLGTHSSGSSADAVSIRAGAVPAAEKAGKAAAEKAAAAAAEKAR